MDRRPLKVFPPKLHCTHSCLPSCVTIRLRAHASHRLNVWRNSCSNANASKVDTRSHGSLNTSPATLLSFERWQSPDRILPGESRSLKLTRTIGELHKRLPTLLISPLPQEILSPQISLYLFPSTHPHLPTVTGKLAYSAALWTAPVAWGRVPVVGNVKLTILSERMVKDESSEIGIRSEKLIVRWRTRGKSRGRTIGTLYEAKYGDEGQTKNVRRLLEGNVVDDEEFSGLFIFEFDEEGRIISHTIENTEEGRNWEKATRVVSVTDWLISKAKGTARNDGSGLTLGYYDENYDTNLGSESTKLNGSSINEVFVVKHKMAFYETVSALR